MTSRPFGILGGTFDPVHQGHLAVAAVVRRALGLSRILLVPARVPPHRSQPEVSIYHRFAMVGLAALTAEYLVASDVDLDSHEPSYTSALLDRFRAAGHDPSQMVFITGADAFAEIATWHDYPAVLDRAHFVAVSRPGLRAAGLVAHFSDLAERFVDLGSNVVTNHPSFDTLFTTPAIFLIDADTPEVSSTEIRERLRTNGSLRELMPDSVADYIRRHELYADA
jgi:nicotinate-nucleotide adenylyltransferase